MAVQNLGGGGGGGVNKVHYGLWENGEFSWNEVEYDFEFRYIVLKSAWLN